MGINIEKSPKMAQGLFAAISLFQLSALLKLLLHIGLGSCTGTRENGSLSDEDYIRLVSHICFTLVVEETLRNTDKLLSCQVNASFCHHPLAAASTLIAAPPNGTSNSSEKTCSFTVGSAQWPSQAHVKKNTWQRNMLYHLQSFSTLVPCTSFQHPYNQYKVCARCHPQKQEICSRQHPRTTCQRRDLVATDSNEKMCANHESRLGGRLYLPLIIISGAM